MKKVACGFAIVLAFLGGVLTATYLPLGYLEEGELVDDLRFTKVILGGQPYHALTGFYGSAFGARGNVKLRVQDDTCNILIEHSLINHGQQSGRFAYLFEPEPKCVRYTFGQNQVPL